MRGFGWRENAALFLFETEWQLSYCEAWIPLARIPSTAMLEQALFGHTSVGVMALPGCSVCLTPFTAYFSDA